MKMSLLLEREPFDQIFISTMENYWTSITGQKHTVKWLDKSAEDFFRKEKDKQNWYGNIHLNFFAVPEAPIENFDNLRKEYGNAQSIWKKPLQKLYVCCSLSQSLRKNFSQVMFTVSPSIENSEQVFILGGNRRLRVVYPTMCTNVVLLKAGYPSYYLTNDVEIRNKMSLNFAPFIKKVDKNNGWYEEEYVSGTPINRISSKIRDVIRVESTHALLKQLVEPTLNAVSFLDYVEEISIKLESFVMSKIAQADMVTEFLELIKRIRSLSKKWASSTTSVPLSMTHGDFQDGNILYGDHKFTVIDWESVDSRHAANDILVNALGVRSQQDWHKNVDHFVNNAKNFSYKNWPGLSSRLEIQLSLLCFLLEELKFSLWEMFEVGFIKISIGALSKKMFQIKKVLQVVA